MLLLHSVLLIVVSLGFVSAQQQQDPTTLNGGSVLAMAGDECVALAVDKRFGSGSQMVNIAPRHVLIPHPKLMVAFTGLEGDVQSLSQELSIQVSDKLQRGRLGFMTTTTSDRHQLASSVSPTAMATLTSHVLYGRRQAPYYVEPIVVGLQEEEFTAREATSHDSKDDKEGVALLRPFLCSHDLLGAQSRSNAFVCAGVASKSMYGTAEALWRPNLSKEELTRVCGKAFLSALERDCLSGYGATVYLLSRDGVIEYDLACRND